MPNDFCHLELNTDDAGKAREFYGKLFSWKFETAQMPGGPYHMIAPGEGPGGGIQKKPMPEAPNMWLVYIQVDAIEPTLKAAPGLGGKVIVPKTAIPGMGHFAILQDPTGAPFGIWTKG